MIISHAIKAVKKMHSYSADGVQVNTIYTGAQFGNIYVAQLVKNPPAMQETWVRSLGWEDSLAKGKVPTPVFWAGKFHGL